MNPFSILMFCFSGALILYAGLLALTKDCRLIPRDHTAKPGNKKAYAVNMAKAIALTAVPPAHCAIAALFNGLLALTVFVVELVMALWIGATIMREHLK